MLEENKIHQGDCMELMQHIPDKSVDMILCDLPYGTTACSWDIVIPFNKLWENYKRIIKENGIIVLTASQPFTSVVVMSNIDLFKHHWVWDKIRGVGHLLAEKRPMMTTEDIIVFYKDLTQRKQQVSSFKGLREYFYKLLCYMGETNKSIAKKLGHRRAEHCFYVLPKKEVIEKVGQRADHCFRYGSTQWDLPTKETYEELIKIFEINKFVDFKTYSDLREEYLEEEIKFKEVIYNPQMREREKPRKSINKGNTECYSGNGKEFNGDILEKKYPINILRFNKSSGKDLLSHPTQKPVALFEYLIKTYTNEGDLVLDNCIGSGTTAIACIKTNRNFIGIEKEQKYCDIANKRISETKQQQTLKPTTGGLLPSKEGNLIDVNSKLNPSDLTLDSSSQSLRVG